jgi:hypothetical protein
MKTAHQIGLGRSTVYREVSRAGIRFNRHVPATFMHRVVYLTTARHDVAGIRGDSAFQNAVIVRVVRHRIEHQPSCTSKYAICGASSPLSSNDSRHIR